MNKCIICGKVTHSSVTSSICACNDCTENCVSERQDEYKSKRKLALKVADKSYNLSASYILI